MQYRHIYHAGNFADVFKHCILIMLCQALLQKEKPICYFDTHAGIGRYDLGSEAAQKTREYFNGIGRLYELSIHAAYPETIKAYLTIVRSVNKTDTLRFYPGSPHIVHSLLRQQDRMVLAELYPEDFAALKQEFRGDKRVAVHHQNGFQSLKAFLPPKKGRGLILIDPAYEERSELQNIISAIKIALAKFPIGIYAIWYPIKELTPVQKFQEQLMQLAPDNILFPELTVNERVGLKKCGMAIINPPWRFEEVLNPTLTWLTKMLATDIMK